MEYLVIELDGEPHIITINEVNSSKTAIEGKTSHFNSGGEPVIFKDKNTAFRVSSQCRRGLVYPIIDIMKILKEIKEITKLRGCDSMRIIDELLAITDKII